MNIYENLRNLLLNEYENNLFITPDRCQNHVYGIVEGYDQKMLFTGIQKIYYICDFYDPKNCYLLNFLSKTKIKIEILHCNLEKFVSLYPEFENKLITSRENLYSLIYKEKNIGLPGYFILDKLIIGESFDFDNCHTNSPEKIVEKLKKNGTTDIVNMATNCVEQYNSRVLNVFSQNDIRVFHFPVNEDKESIEEKEYSLHQAADLIHEKIQGGGSVYLHCYMGKNRSVATGILYMVKHLKMTLKDAYLAICLKKITSVQDTLLEIIYKEALKNERYPVALHKLQSEEYFYMSLAMRPYDLFVMDVISGRKPNLGLSVVSATSDKY